MFRVTLHVGRRKIREPRRADEGRKHEQSLCANPISQNLRLASSPGIVRMQEKTHSHPVTECEKYKAQFQRQHLSPVRMRKGGKRSTKPLPCVKASAQDHDGQSEGNRSGEIVSKLYYIVQFTLSHQSRNCDEASDENTSSPYCNRR